MFAPGIFFSAFSMSLMSVEIVPVMPLTKPSAVLMLVTICCTSAPRLALPKMLSMTDTGMFAR